MQQGPETHFCSVSVSLFQLRGTERAGNRAGSRNRFKNIALNPNAMLNSAEQPMESLCRNQRAVSADKPHFHTQHALSDAGTAAPIQTHRSYNLQSHFNSPELKLQLPKSQGASAHSDTLLSLPLGFRTLVLAPKTVWDWPNSKPAILFPDRNSHPPEEGGGEVTVTGPQICNCKPQHLHRKHKPCFSSLPATSLHCKQNTVCCLRWRRETCFYVCTKVHAGKGSDILVRGTLQGLQKITEKQSFACPKATNREAYK